MSLTNWKTVFLAVGLIGILVFTLPSVLLVVHAPAGEPFSELYILGSNGMAADYPFNVSEGQTYLIYLGIGNHMGQSVFYEVDVKFKNSTDPLPNATNGEASPLPAVYKYRVFLSDGNYWEAPLTFSPLNVSLANDVSSIGSLAVNGVPVEVDKVSAWNNLTLGFYYQMLIELWRYNTTSGSLGFDSRFVDFWLNATERLG